MYICFPYVYVSRSGSLTLTLSLTLALSLSVSLPRISIYWRDSAVLLFLDNCSSSSHLAWFQKRKKFKIFAKIIVITSKQTLISKRAKVYINTHTHTHSHSQIYTPCVCVCIYIDASAGINFRSDKRVELWKSACNMRITNHLKRSTAWQNTHCA